MFGMRKQNGKQFGYQYPSGTDSATYPLQYCRKGTRSACTPKYRHSHAETKVTFPCCAVFPRITAIKKKNTGALTFQLIFFR